VLVHRRHLHEDREVLPLEDGDHHRRPARSQAEYEALFDDAGLPRDSLPREDLRLYRLVAREVGTSPPAVSAGSPPPPAPLPGLEGELLGPGTLDEL